jgi:hypothetical protein
MRAADLVAAVGVFLLLASSPASAGETIRGYVTQIAIGQDGIRVWIAPEKGVKGRGDVVFDSADPMARYKVDLARDSIKRRLPVKVHLNERGIVTSFVLRVYPSTKQKGDAHE